MLLLFIGLLLFTPLLLFIALFPVMPPSDITRCGVMCSGRVMLTVPMRGAPMGQVGVSGDVQIFSCNVSVSVRACDDQLRGAGHSG